MLDASGKYTVVFFPRHTKSPGSRRRSIVHIAAPSATSASPIRRMERPTAVFLQRERPALVLAHQNLEQPVRNQLMQRQ